MVIKEGIGHKYRQFLKNYYRNTQKWEGQGVQLAIMETLNHYSGGSTTGT